MYEYVCVYIYIYTCMNIYMHIYKNIYIYIYVCICIHAGAITGGTGVADGYGFVAYV
jgi:hypothetical protein